ncbi:MAG TPA: tetratricopeptide repeat protein [Candidatus Omnitrophota bacterium]|nr:tetratricopeptide repeat protein [Candidatus Omnitrophota bacterium]
MGRIFYYSGQICLAEQYLQQTVAAEPGHFNAFFYLGKLYLDRGRVEDALTAFRNAEEINPGHGKLREDIIKEYRAFFTAHSEVQDVKRELERLQSL